tara:strand:- start:584 stop:973 length:390 start_codon:yes stop_codon:yes gene_type:complete
MEINNLVDLSSFRSAPELNNIQIKKLSYELQDYILNSDWITVGIMASHDFEAVTALKSISQKYPSIKFNVRDTLHANGRVFLKGNQKTGNVFIRSENGLGEGILLTCQYEEDSGESTTFGPLPLNFFTN